MVESILHVDRVEKADGSPVELPGYDKVKPWVNMNGNNASVLASYGVSSTLDQGTGRYDINWSTMFASSDYAAVGSSSGGTAYTCTLMVGDPESTGTPKTASMLNLSVRSDNGAKYDSGEISVLTRGDLA